MNIFIFMVEAVFLHDGRVGSHGTGADSFSLGWLVDRGGDGFTFVLNGVGHGDAFSGGVADIFDRVGDGGVDTVRLVSVSDGFVHGRCDWDTFRVGRGLNRIDVTAVFGGRDCGGGIRISHIIFFIIIHVWDNHGLGMVSTGRLGRVSIGRNFARDDIIVSTVATIVVGDDFVVVSIGRLVGVRDDLVVSTGMVRNDFVVVSVGRLVGVGDDLVAIASLFGDNFVFVSTVGYLVGDDVIVSL